MRRGRLQVVGLSCVAAVLLTSAHALPAVGAAQPQPDRCARQPGTQHRPCVGPVTDESGGGGDALTIALSVVVGVAVAVIAFVLLRRQMRRGAPSIPDASPPTAGDA